MRYQCCYGRVDIDRLPLEAEEMALNNYLLPIFRMERSINTPVAVRMEDAISFDKASGIERDAILREKFPSLVAERDARIEAHEQRVSAEMRASGLRC